MPVTIRPTYLLAVSMRDVNMVPHPQSKVANLRITNPISFQNYAKVLLIIFT